MTCLVWCLNYILFSLASTLKSNLIPGSSLTNTMLFTFGLCNETRLCVSICCRYWKANDQGKRVVWRPCKRWAVTVPPLLLQLIPWHNIPMERRSSVKTIPLQLLWDEIYSQAHQLLKQADADRFMLQTFCHLLFLCMCKHSKVFIIF